MEDIKERKLRFSYLTILFVLISFLGWCGETVYFVLRWDDFTDRGFLSFAALHDIRLQHSGDIPDNRDADQRKA